MITPNLLRGEQVRLTAPTAADLPAITRWWADADFLRLYNTAHGRAAQRRSAQPPLRPEPDQQRDLPLRHPPAG